MHAYQIEDIFFYLMRISANQDQYVDETSEIEMGMLRWNSAMARLRVQL